MTVCRLRPSLRHMTSVAGATTRAFGVTVTSVTLTRRTAAAGAAGGNGWAANGIIA